jgi:hypothetical protein
MVCSDYRKLCSPILGIAPFRLSAVRSSSSATCLSSATAYTSVFIGRNHERFMQSTDKNLQALMQSTDKFVQAADKNIQELKNATMANSRDIQELKSYTTQAMSRLEGQIGHLVTELNRIEEEELQSQLMIERHYMGDEDDFENSYQKHAQVTTTLDEDVIVNNNEEQVENIEQIEHHEKSQPPIDPNLPSNMEVSTEAPPASLPLLRHIKSPKLHLLYVSKNHLISRYSRIYAHKRENLGTTFLKRFFKGSNST